MTQPQDDIAIAQRRFDQVNDCLDRLLSRERDALARTVRERGDEREMWERDVRAAASSRQISTLSAARDGLMFGRLLLLAGEDLFIGRLGVSDPETREHLLIDWRAPVARAFYTATPLHPEGVSIRAHIRTDRTTVLDYTAEHISGDAPALRTDSAGTSALFSALERTRTGRMGDIVATIQAEQDRIIRSPLEGALLVQGGPGTGKTVVALHRAAFLLYEHRARLERRGVLVIGPNPRFLSYIGDVLPSLGEENVVLRTVATLLPGIEATHDDPMPVAECKGDQRMIEVVRAAIDATESLTRAVTVTLDSQEVIIVEPDTMRNMRAAATRDTTEHNEARLAFERVFVRLVSRALIAKRHPNSRLNNDPSLRDETVQELREDAGFVRACDQLWPILTPEQLITRLYTDAAFRARCTHAISPRERELLRFTQDVGKWSVSDIPVLDEARVMLGEDPRPRLRAEAREQAEARREREYAQGVLDILTDTTTDDTGTQGSAVTAEQLASRQREHDNRTLAERASADPGWTFGHAIVDEAQELSPMALRAIIRRCPSQSMTLVGDINQAAPRSTRPTWQSLLDPQLRRLREEHLTVNYRTPEAIMRLASSVLHQIDPELRAPVSIRTNGTPRRVLTTDTSTLLSLIHEVVGEHDLGTIAVIAPNELIAELRDALDDKTWVGSASESKGLEFDSVVLVNPSSLIEEAETGLTGLYVALTRATQQLTVVSEGLLPTFLAQVDIGPENNTP